MPLGVDGEPTGEHPFDLAVIAVTVARLCERDEVPEVCARINVYYNHSWLEAATATKFPPSSVRAAQQERMLVLIVHP